MSKVNLDWDREADVLYVLKDGFQEVRLCNVDSDRIPGVVKRLVPETGECVGFIIEAFSYVLPAHSKLTHASMVKVFQESIDLTNKLAELTSDKDSQAIAV